MLKLRKYDIKKAVEGSGGIMSNVARLLNCNWHTAKKYITKYKLDKEFEALKETQIDFAFTKLLENIRANDTTSIIFFLKTIGRNRGFVEKQELTHTLLSGIDVTKFTDYGLTRIIAGEKLEDVIKDPRCLIDNV